MHDDTQRSTVAAPTQSDTPRFETPAPTLRRLQIYAFDPSFDTDLDKALINRSTISVDWEDDLQPGPVGQYLEIIDVHPPSRLEYPPVNLDDPRMLAQDGLPPSEGNPQFHQQMVYAVAMRTIANFEVALGRTVQWSARHVGPGYKEEYVQRLKVYPHGLQEENAYYSPEEKALRFGYFDTRNTDSRVCLPGGRVFTCLSYDIIAHETTHAILDGLHRRLLYATNCDVLAFHEAFADLVAVFQHFTLPGVLEHEIAKTRGDLQTENLLAKLAVQFGTAINRGSALRDALGTHNGAANSWSRREPDPNLFRGTTAPHARGGLFVAAAFDAFLAIYQTHTADLLRLASGGTGILAAGALHPDLVSRLAREAREVAQRLLTILIRALDYLPPVDVTFGDYVRALITIDSDLVPEDKRNYRIAILRSFRNWGIYPLDVRTLSVDELRWNRPSDEDADWLRTLLPPLAVLRTIAFSCEYAPELNELLEDEESRGPGPPARMIELSRSLISAYQPTERKAGKISRDSDWMRAAKRRPADFQRERQFRRYLHEHLESRFAALPGSVSRQRISWLLGIDPLDGDRRFEVHAIRPTIRARRDGRTKTELLVMITQRESRKLRLSLGSAELRYFFRGGCTMLVDPESGEVRYAIAKDLCSAERRSRQEQFLGEQLEQEGLEARGRYGVWSAGERHRPVREPFRLLHGCGDRGG